MSFIHAVKLTFRVRQVSQSAEGSCKITISAHTPATGDRKRRREKDFASPNADAKIRVRRECVCMREREKESEREREKEDERRLYCT